MASEERTVLESSGMFQKVPQQPLHSVQPVSHIGSTEWRVEGGKYRKKLEIEPCQRQGDAKRKRVRKCPGCQGRDPPCSPPKPHTRAEAYLLQQWQPVEKTLRWIRDKV